MRRVITGLRAVGPLFATKFAAFHTSSGVNKGLTTFGSNSSFHYEYCMPLENALKPDDKQKIDHGSCFLMAPIITRHQLQLLDPNVWSPGKLDVLSAMKKLHEKNPTFVLSQPGSSDKFAGGVPIEAFKVIVSSSVDKERITDLHVPAILQRIKQLPAVLPYLPTFGGGHVVVVSVDDFVNRMHENMLVTIKYDEATKKIQEANEQKQLAASEPTPPSWHSQAVVGLATDPKTQQQYFVARQTWVGSTWTLIPILTVEQIMDKWTDLGLDTGIKVERQLVLHHHVLFPVKVAAVEDGIVNDALSFAAGPATYSAAARSSDVNTLSGPR
jgi:hypothetical protein